MSQYTCFLCIEERDESIEGTMELRDVTAPLPGNKKRKITPSPSTSQKSEHKIKNNYINGN